MEFFVTSLVLRTHSCGAVVCPAVFFYNSPSVTFIASYEKSEQVQQANVLKRQTLTFNFSIKRFVTYLWNDPRTYKFDECRCLNSPTLTCCMTTGWLVADTDKSERTHCPTSRFYAGCPSCHNSSSSPGLGTGLQYVGLHTW